MLTATVVTIAGNVLGRLLGFVREAYFASYFGTSGILDTFIIAFTIPELIGMILFSAMPMALIPMVKSSQTTNENEESRHFWGGLVWFAAGFGLLAVLFHFFRQEIVYWLAPNLTAEMSLLAEDLSGILSAFIFVRGLEIYFRSWCFQKKHFLAPALSSIIVNLIIISSLVLLYERFHVKALAYGWVADSIILLLFNGYFALKVVKPKFDFRLDSSWALALTRSLLVVALIECISMSYSLVDRFFAGHYLGPGPISALRYASTLISVPSGVFVAAFNVASFPWISEHLKENRLEELRSLYGRTIRSLFLFMGLAAVGIVIFAQDIIRIALQRGEFDETSLQLTIMPLVIYAIGLTFQAVYTFQMRFYFASRQLVRLGLILLLMLAIKIMLSSLFVTTLGHKGLALASTCAVLVGFSMMTIDVGKNLKFGFKSELALFLAKSLSVLALIAIIWIGLKSLWPSSLAEPLDQLFLKLALFAITGMALLFILGKPFNIAESERVRKLILTKIMRKRPEVLSKQSSFR